MYPSMNRHPPALKRLPIGILVIATAVLALSQTARAQKSCPATLGDIQWAAPNPSNQLTVGQLLSPGTLNCNTPIYFGLHRGAATRALDLDGNNNLLFPNFGSPASTSSGQGFASPTGLITAGGEFPVFPQTVVSVAIPAYQSYLSSNRGHLPSNIDPTGTLTVEDGGYNAWPAIIELDPRQDSTGTWWLFHSTSTNQDAVTPNLNSPTLAPIQDPNAIPQTVLPIGGAILGSNYALYRAAPMLHGYESSKGAPAIDQFASAGDILDRIMTDPSVNMVLQLHTRTYSDTLAFYTWLLQTWAPAHTNAEMIRVINKIYFCVDLNKMAPPGSGSTTNDYNNLGYMSAWQTQVKSILSATQAQYPQMPIALFPPVALMVNFYDDTNLSDIPNVDLSTDVDKAIAILTANQKFTNVKYLGLEITDENSSADQELQLLGSKAKVQLGMQIGKSVLTPDHFIPVTDAGGNAAIKYGLLQHDAPAPLVTGNNSGIVAGYDTYQDAWAANAVNLVDLHFSLSWQLGVMDTDPNSPMYLYDPKDNEITQQFQVEPTIVLSDLPLIHSMTKNGEVRSVFPGSYTDARCNAGIGQYPGCKDPNAPGTSTYTLCTTEGAACTFTGDRNVVFGANGTYTNPVTFTNTTACTTSAFNQPDPTPGVVKACYYSSAIPYAPGIYCADEGQTCNFGGDAWPIMSANGRYGYAPDSTGYARLYSNSFPCAASTFSGSGESAPAPGFQRACSFEARQGYAFSHSGPSGYVFCEGEGNGSNVCQFKGPGRIAFGAIVKNVPKFNYRVFDGGVPCNIDVFGDPAPGSTKDCWYQSVTAAGTAGSLGNNPPGGGTGSNPPGGGLSNGGASCDLYASGGTPCVAAHSTVRALFSAYSGRLYQVKRALDSTTVDIGTLAAGGYANAAAQDSFCANTTCTITTIYDQTSKHNDLAIEGGGGAAPNPDSGAVANALPITLNGNVKVYGVKVTPGVGYRNNATTGVAKGGSPEGMYMVTSGTYVNSGCCFDYGNAEENSNDNGNGRMDAINFGTACVFAPCSGSGPWVEADLENGQYMGNGSNLGDQPISSDFVTAMLKNNGQTTFALKAGNAQGGALATEYSGSLPTIKPGYTPMNLEGAIVLGTGGDNSNASLGAFFEGAMTSGYPTDATENAVQTNIVGAGYSGDSSGGSGTTGVIEPAGPYTGPNDPGGPGPQDGFASPATEQPNDIMATKPAFASFNGSLYVAFQGVGVDNDLYVTSSPSGYNFPTATRYTNIQSSSAAALAVYNNQLFMAFRGLNVDNDFYITSSPTGSNFPTATRYTNIQMGGAPALAVFNNQLFAAFQANDASHNLFITSSSDGYTWPTAWQIPNVKIGSDPALAVFNGMLYVAFRADDPSNAVWIASSPDGVNFTSQKLSQTMDGYSSPALVASNGVLYYIYEANDQGHEMLVTASTDGSTWQGPAAYLNVQMGPTGPGAAAFANGVSVGFQSNDSRNVLFVTSVVNEAGSYTGPTDSGSGGLQDTFSAPAAQQPNDIMGSKPALAAFHGSVYAAFEGVGVNNDLYVTSSPTGSNFPTATQYPNLQSSSAPALAQFNNQLFVAFRGLGVNNDLYTTSSQTGTNFPTATRHTNIQMGGAPAMALFNNQLYIAFQANDSSHTLFVTRSTDGVTWPTAYPIPNVQIGSDPAMTVFDGLLYVAFRANDPSNDVWIASSADGVNFTSYKLAGQTMAWGSSPALAVVNQNDGNYLYYVYEANDSSHEMLVSTTTDGSNWQSPALYSNIQMGATGPAATGFGNTSYVAFQSNDARNVLFVTSQPVSGNTASAGVYVPNSTFYPRMVQLSHGSSATNGNIVASTDGNIFVKPSNATGFTFTGTVPSQYGYHLGSGTLYELPQTVGSLQAGTLLYAATYYYGSTRSTAIEVNTSTDGGQTWTYSSMPVSGAGYAGDGFWEPQFTVANDGALVMFWSDETDSCCSQKISQIRTYNGISWQDRSNTVASGVQADRPGMAVVTKLPSGVYFMSYELCGPASCTAFYRTSTDGWNFGTSGNTGTKIQTASGQYFVHAPTNVWSPSVLGTNGALLLMGQQLVDSTGAADPNSGSQMFVNLSRDGSGPWYTIAAPGRVPNPADNYCPNYSTALLPLSNGSTIAELASSYNDKGQCVSFFSTEAWNNLPADGSTHALVNQHPGFCLDDYGWGTTNGTPADLWNCTGSTIQAWTLHAQGNGYFSLQNEVTGLCVDDAGGSTTPGNKVVLWGCTANNPNQNWQFMDLGNGQYKLWNQAAGLPLDDTGGSLSSGTQLQVWIDNSLDAQHWVLH